MAGIAGMTQAGSPTYLKNSRQASLAAVNALPAPHTMEPAGSGIRPDVSDRSPSDSRQDRHLHDFRDVDYGPAQLARDMSIHRGMVQNALKRRNPVRKVITVRYHALPHGSLRPTACSAGTGVA